VPQLRFNHMELTLPDGALTEHRQELKDFYVSAGPQMFEKAHLLARLRRFYDADPLCAQLQDVLGNRILGAPDLKALLLIVTRNATTDSP